jgi:hypothetical protein
MNANIENLYQEIGQELLATVSDLQGKLLVYAEVQEGVIADSLFFERGNEHVVTFKFLTDKLQDLIYSLWEKWKSQPNESEWRAISYLLQDGNFTIDLTYPDQINSEEDQSERRPAINKKYFGDVKVDYSNPNL